MCIKKVPDNTSNIVIVRRPDMLNHLRFTLKTAPMIYSIVAIQEMGDKLASLCNKSEEERQQHIDNIRNKCPFCGSELVLRKGKYGPFYGCSSYPKCKFTRPINTL
ncbi:MAG: hypothetical protein HDR15_08995 [Lachnospiraceae bacterium]|nr:hypothetical protein [Lachnospiraceae bacterium]